MFWKNARNFWADGEKNVRNENKCGIFPVYAAGLRGIGNKALQDQPPAVQHTFIEGRPDEADVARRLGEAYKERDQAQSEARQAREQIRQYNGLLRSLLAGTTGNRMRLCDRHELPPRRGETKAQVALRPETLRDLRHAVRSATETLGFDSVRRHDIELAAGEVALRTLFQENGGKGEVCLEPRAKIIQIWIEDRPHESNNAPGNGVLRFLAEHHETSVAGGTLWTALRTVDRVWLCDDARGVTVVLEQGDEPPPFSLPPAWFTAMETDL